MRKTGWDPPALMQDDHRGLSQWFATRPDARYVFKRNQRKKQMKTMTIAQLREEIDWLDGNVEVYIWVDGNRYPISMVDDNFTDNMIDINAYVGEAE